jgi:cytochrome c553
MKRIKIMFASAAMLMAGVILSGAVSAADGDGMQGDPERGRQLAPDCAACHGSNGVSPSAAFPIIAGQHEAYLFTSLVAYRDRSRDNAIMSAAVVGKSDQDLRDLAAWFASRKGLGAGQQSAGASAETVSAAETVSGSLLAQGGSDLNVISSALPDAGRCPEATDKDAAADSDNDGLPDIYDAVPDDADEFVLDTNADGRFEICSIQQLQAILTLGEQGSTALDLDSRMARDYELVRDIDASSQGFRPIGNCGPSGNCMNDLDKYGFKGSFDGRGHVISNLTIDAPDVGGVGLFGVISTGKVVSNIELRNVRTNGRAGTGTVVGSNFGTVYNCHATGSATGMFAIGGLVGANAGNISYSHADVEVSGQMAVGGLVGDQNTTVFASYATGDVQAGRGAGGLVGLNTRGRVVSSYATGNVSGGKDIGGLVGLNTDALLANSFATGAVVGSEINAGALVGFNSMSRIRNAWASGSVNGAAAVGGIAGNNNGLIAQTWMSGAVSGAKEVGSLVGKNADGNVQDSYFATENTGLEDASGTAEGEFSQVQSVAFAALQSVMLADSLLNASADPEWVYCDTDGSGVIEDSEQAAANRIWDYGSSTELPALRCVPGGVNAQRK